MAYYVGKVLQEALWPLNWALAGLLVTAWLSWRRNDRRAVIPATIAFVVLFFASLPVVGKALFRPLETHYPVRPVAEYPQADAIVVLGGSVHPKLPPRMKAEELAGSRLRPAAQLFAAGKAPIVIPSSGVPYIDSDGKERWDGEDMKDLLVEMGVPPDAVHPELRSRNTRENASESGRLLRARGAKRILLVTSAFHLRRSVRLFEKEGFEVIPVPAAIETSDEPLHLKHLIPDARALVVTTRAIKEYAGAVMGY